MKNPDNISIRSLATARRAKRRCDAILTIEDPGLPLSKVLRYRNSPHPPQLILRFEDIDDEDAELATVQPYQVEAAIKFAREFGNRHLLIHCRAGISRSAAMAYAILCDRFGPGREKEAMDAVFRIRPPACPNLLVSQIADNLLGRNGAMMEQLYRSMTDRPSYHAMVTARRQHLRMSRYEYALRSRASGYNVQLIHDRSFSQIENSVERPLVRKEKIPAIGGF